MSLLHILDKWINNPKVVQKWTNLRVEPPPLDKNQRACMKILNPLEPGVWDRLVFPKFLFLIFRKSRETSMQYMHAFECNKQ